MSDKAMRGAATAAPLQADAAAWRGLHSELAAWTRAGRKAAFWWRDDDASSSSAALDRLLGLSDETGVPVALAVVPAWLDPSLRRALAGNDSAVVCQHGWQHVNHAKGLGGKGAWELGLHRGRDAVLADLQSGYLVLQAEFGARFLSVVVPPWNNIDPGLIPDLSGAGYIGVSAFGDRPPEAGAGNTANNAASGIIINNCHCDPVDWKSGKRFRGTERTLNMLVAHLHSRRIAASVPEEARPRAAAGLLTHHLDMDGATWEFTDQLLKVLASSPAVDVLRPEEVFAA